jgi:integrase
MPLYKRPGSPFWHVRIGRKTRRSTGTEDRGEAEEFEERLRQRLWRLRKLGDRSAVSFREVAARWLNETNKRTKDRDEQFIAWMEEQVGEEPISALDRDAIEELRQIMVDDGLKHSSIDRYFSILRAILRKCEREWRYLEHAPVVPMFGTEEIEPRWLTKLQFEKLAKKLPKHLELAARIAVLTGLRMRSMLKLTWDRVDLRARRLWIPGAQMKAGRSHGVPISKEAATVFRQLRTLNPKGMLVFQWKENAIDDCNTKAFQTAVKDAGVAPLRWHDLRHTFASWAVQSGVTLHELMQLGGWKSYDMVLRYAHLAPDHLASAAEKVSTKGAQRKKAAGAKR